MATSTVRMVRSYSEQERRQAVELMGEVGCREAARRLGVPKSTLYRWRQLGPVSERAEVEGEPPDVVLESEPVEESEPAGEPTSPSKPTTSPSKSAVARRYTPSDPLAPDPSKRTSFIRF
jgi:transposase-like protein